MTTLVRRLALPANGILLLTVYVTAWLVTRTTLYQQEHATLGAAIWIDLVVTCALIHYGLGVRIARLPGWTVLPVLGSGFTLAILLSPGLSQQSTTLFLVIAGATELTIAGIVLWRGAQLIRAYRDSRSEGAVTLEAIEAALEKVTGFRWLAVAVRFEIEIMLLAILGWFRKPRLAADQQAFTVHRKVAWFPLVGILAGLSVLEGGMVHYLLWRADYSTLAGVITLLHIYALLWLAGDAQALRLYPTTVDTRIHLRLGNRWSAVIELENIRQVKAINGPPPDSLQLTLVGSPNVLLELADDVEVKGLFGVRKQSRRLALSVDEPQELIDAVRTAAAKEE